MGVSGSVVVVGAGRVAPAVAAAFAFADRVVVAGRDTGRARAAADAATALAGRTIEPAPIAASTVADASVVVECVVEDFGVKTRLLAELDGWLGAETLLVSNTSSLSLDDLAEPLRHRGRFAGLHFLHPAHLTGVVEVVPISGTDARTTERLLAIVELLGKRPILVRRPLPGFVWNRLQMAVLRECLALVEEGVADAGDVDAAVADGLAPRWLAAGPLGTADAGGLATFTTVARELFPVLSSAAEPPRLLVDAQERGGIYEWTDDELASLERVRADALAAGATFAEARPRPAPATRPRDGG